jgi:hypothetical protein
VIGKVIRGTNVRSLLKYLFGPGIANEHSDPHLVAGFGDPAELEPERLADGTADVRRLARLMEQPLAALIGPGFDKPVWHCPVRTAPGDRELSDEEWAQVAALIMDKTGLAPDGDEFGVRWVAVRHASDHVHLVATLARQDGTRPRIWNDFYRVREGCLEAERRFGLAVTAPADRTAGRRPSRGETEQAKRRGWGEAPRVRLRRAVSGAAAGARSEQEFFDLLAADGVLVRKRYSTVHAGEVTGFAVGLAEHVAKDGGTIWYGGGKLAADLTLPKLRHRWAGPDGADALRLGDRLTAGGARGVLRALVGSAAERASDEAGFFGLLRADGVLMRLRFSELDPGQVTGFSVSLPGHAGGDGRPAWYGGGRLAAELSLPRLRRRWRPELSAGAPGSGAFGLTAAERSAVFEHAARQAGAAASQIRRCAGDDPGLAADAAHAAGDLLNVAARMTGNRGLRRAAECYERAGRMPYGRVPRCSQVGAALRASARLVALAGRGSGHGGSPVVGLLAGIAELVAAVSELRRVQQHVGQVAAAGEALEYVRSDRRPGAGTGRRSGVSARIAGEPAAAARVARSGVDGAVDRGHAVHDRVATPVRRPATPGPRGRAGPECRLGLRSGSLGCLASPDDTPAACGFSDQRPG